jgi:flagellar hook-basal body complex protein FliE
MANITPAASPLAALQQLQNTATGAPASGGVAAIGGQSGGDATFGNLVQQSLQSAINAQHTSEKVSAASLTGKADMTEVLQAVNNAELALNTVIAVRDRVVQAYQQVMSMPI